MTLPVCIPTLPGKPLKGAHGIGACAQDEHQGRAARHVLIQSGQVYWRCLDKLLAKILYHKVCKSKNHLKVRKKKNVKSSMWDEDVLHSYSTYVGMSLVS